MRTITAYEHETLCQCPTGAKPEANELTAKEFDALARYHSRNPWYYSLTHRGIKLCQWVGLLRVGALQLEVLPKLADGDDPSKAPAWREFLLDILVRAGLIGYKKVPESHTGTRNTLLDLLLWHYLHELEGALHKGLIKRYRRQEGNGFALKGKLLFEQNLRHNLVHQERFYTAYTVYDFDHGLNQLLAAALHLIPSLTHSAALRNTAAQLCLSLPPISEKAHPAALIDRIRRDRKSAPFDSLITLARLIVTHHHPSLSTGEDETFSLMFDMNAVFEAWLRAELGRIDGVVVSKPSLAFLSFPNQHRSTGIPDLVVQYQGNCYVRDAKWKRVNEYAGVSVDDLRQIYTYLH